MFKKIIFALLPIFMLGCSSVYDTGTDLSYPEYEMVEGHSYSEVTETLYMTTSHGKVQVFYDNGGIEIVHELNRELNPFRPGVGIEYMPSRLRIYDEHGSDGYIIMDYTHDGILFLRLKGELPSLITYGIFDNELLVSYMGVKIFPQK